MISVIVPVYNIKEYLPECVDSILSQTFSDLEIILVDDGSTDGCAEICDAYAGKDRRIQAVHKENGGLVSARKAGLRVASGQYIGCVDGDDWIEPDMYERMYRRMQEEDVDVVMCGRYEDTGTARKEVYHGVEEGRYGKAEMLRSIYPRMIAGEAFFEWGIFPGVWDKLFKREFLEPFQLAVDERLVMGEDAACAWPCLLHAGSMYVMHECLYHYRQTVSSMVKRVQDYGKERLQFKLLYQTVRDSLARSAYIYDLREQWKKYVLFLTLPRSDGLYRGYEKLSFLFPFPKVKRDSSIILYGAGTYGQRLYGFLQRTGFCSVTAWVDRNHVQLREMGLPVESPSVIPGRVYDGIVIANTYQRSRDLLYRELVVKYPEEKVHMLDEELVFSTETMEAFGLVPEEGPAADAGRKKGTGS